MFLDRFCFKPRAAAAAAGPVPVRMSDAVTASSPRAKAMGWADRLTRRSASSKIQGSLAAAPRNADLGSVAAPPAGHAAGRDAFAATCRELADRMAALCSRAQAEPAEAGPGLVSVQQPRLPRVMHGTPHEASAQAQAALLAAGSLEAEARRDAQAAVARRLAFASAEAQALHDALLRLPASAGPGSTVPAPMLERAGGMLRTLQARAAEAAAAARRCRIEANERQNEVVQQLVTQLPGFSPGPKTAALSRRWQEVAGRLPADVEVGTLSRVAVCQLGLPALAQVTGGDAGRADEVLALLASRPAVDWIPRPGVEPAAAGRAGQDVQSLFGLMAQVPRGMDALALMGGHEGAVHGPRLPGEAVMEPLAAYWNAWQAWEAAPPDAQAWLASAMGRAQRKVHGALPDGAPAPQRAAYAAVRNGLLSDAQGSRHAAISACLAEAFTAWVDNGAVAPSAVPAWLPHLHVTQQVSPFKTGTLELAAHAAAQSGLATAGSEAAQAVSRLAGEWLEALAAAPALSTRALAMQTVLLHLQARAQADTAGRPLAAAEVNAMATELAAVRRAAQSAVHAGPAADPAAGRLAHRAGALQHALHSRAADLAGGAAEWAQDGLDAVHGAGLHVQKHPAELQALVRPGDTPAGVLGRVLAQWAGSGLPVRGLTAWQERLEQARGLEAAAGVRHIADGQDLDAVLDPVIQHLQPHDGLRLAGGTDLGASLPYLPLGLLGPVSLSLSGAYHHQSELALDIRRDARGIVFSVGMAREQDAEAGITARTVFNAGVADPMVSVGARAEHDRQQRRAVLLRVPQGPGGEQRLRQDAQDLLHSLVSWRGLPPQDRPDLLSHLLARHEDLEVIDMSRESHSSTIGEFTAKAGLLFGIPTPLAGNPYQVGPQAALALTVSHEHGRRADAGGHGHVLSQRDSGTSRQLTFTAGTSIPGVPGYSRDAFLHGREERVTTTLVGNRIDVEFEHSTTDVRDMQAELASHREDWLMRATWPAAGEGVVHDGSAALQLDGFIADLQRGEGGDARRVRRFTINHTLQEGARTAAEVLEGVGILAASRGDAAVLAEVAAARERLLSSPALRQPASLVVTARDREAGGEGLGVGLIARRTFAAEAEHLVAQFPAA